MDRAQFNAQYGNYVSLAQLGNLAGGAVQGGLPGASLQAVNAGAAGRFGAAQLQSNLQQLGQYQARQGVIANGAMQQISSNAAAANAAADAAGRAALLNSHRLTAMRPGGDRNVGNNQLGGNSQLMQAFTQNQQSALAAALSQQGINLQGMNRLANVGLQNNLSRLSLGSNAVNLLQQGLGGSSASQPAADLLALLSRQTKPEDFPALPSGPGRGGLEEGRHPPDFLGLAANMLAGGAGQGTQPGSRGGGFPALSPPSGPDGRGGQGLEQFGGQGDGSARTQPPTTLSASDLEQLLRYQHQQQHQQAVAAAAAAAAARGAAGGAGGGPQPGGFLPLGKAPGGGAGPGAAPGLNLGPGQQQGMDAGKQALQQQQQQGGPSLPPGTPSKGGGPGIAGMPPGQAASGGPGGPPDKYGLLGLLPLLAMRDLDLTMLSLGTDLTSLGLNLNSTDSLNKLLVSPLSDTPIKAEPDFELPACYKHNPQRLQPGYLAKFKEETLFYIFYSAPTKTARGERGAFLVFNPGVWEVETQADLEVLYEELEQPPRLPRNIAPPAAPQPPTPAQQQQQGGGQQGAGGLPQQGQGRTGQQGVQPAGQQGGRGAGPNGTLPGPPGMPGVGGAPGPGQQPGGPGQPPPGGLRA
ncbi:hypothetical protein V8C86DRAFT_1547105 [Haematococcus lacustris]